jgi:flavorubredoxin
MDTNKLDYSDFVEIADGVFWVGFADKSAGLHCNPYLIAEGGEAVLIDSGSRNDFSTVMLKILRTGTNPKDIKTLIYQHYDPDLCGNIPHMEEMIASEDLKILSHFENNIFINYYSPYSKLQCIEDLGFEYEFKSGRRLEFVRTPYAHSPGSFVTYDTKTKILFSSDLFGSYDTNWSLYANIFGKCSSCDPARLCAETQELCHICGVYDFHKRVMPTSKALHYALERIEKIDISMIAPQHGSIFHTTASVEIIVKRLKELKNVGIESFLEEDS